MGVYRLSAVDTVLEISCGIQQDSISLYCRVIISLTNAVTNLEAASPITNAMANPIIPNILRKSKNSCANDFFAEGGNSLIITVDSILVITSTERSYADLSIYWYYSSNCRDNIQDS